MYSNARGAKTNPVKWQLTIFPILCNNINVLQMLMRCLGHTVVHVHTFTYYIPKSKCAVCLKL